MVETDLYVRVDVRKGTPRGRGPCGTTKTRFLYPTSKGTSMSTTFESEVEVRVKVRGRS